MLAWSGLHSFNRFGDDVPPNSLPRKLRTPILTSLNKPPCKVAFSLPAIMPRKRVRRQSLTWFCLPKLEIDQQCQRQKRHSPQPAIITVLRHYTHEPRQDDSAYINEYALSSLEIRVPVSQRASFLFAHSITLAERLPFPL